LADAVALAGLREDAHRRRRPVDTERLAQGEHQLHLVGGSLAVVGQRHVQAPVILPGLGVAERVSRAYQAGEAQRPRRIARRGEYRVVELLAAQPGEEPETLGVYGKQRTRLAPVLPFLLCVGG